MNTDRAEVVVIGAGLGGLSAASYLAKAGYAVTVLEHHAVPGGYAHEFRRGKYRFEVSLHALDGIDAGGWTQAVFADLDVLSQVEFCRLDPYFVARFPGHEVVGHLDPEKYRDALAVQFPHEAEGLRRLCADMALVFRQAQQMMETKLAGLSMGGALGRFPEYAEALALTWSAYLDRFVCDSRLRAMVSALWGYLGVPPSRLRATAYIVMWGSYHLTGAGYPVGGSMAMSRALERTIKRHGGKILYRQTVSRIILESGKGVAVETEQGLRVEARMFVSNASPKDTMLRFLDSGSVPNDYFQKVDSDPASLGSFAVYLALDCELSALGWAHHEVILFETYDLEADYAYCASGDWRRCNLGLTYYNHADPGCSPPGGSSLALVTLAPWDYENEWGTGGSLHQYRANPRYNEIKNAAAEILIDRAAAVIPGLREHIKYCDVSTPLTNYRYTRNPQGAIYGSVSACSVAAAARLSDETPIPNLFLTGAWVIGGCMSAALLSGAETAIKAGAALRAQDEAQPGAQTAYGAEPAAMSDDELARLLMQELRGGGE